ncbi:hypothetical protein AAHZ94_12640 [Streptomyces sp. HSW2009]|uniref:hypothetical protein n=1 Tax=Streptomyces sp. HSW2009 TaxID=3142890 RepID=UPI0032EAB435
MEVVTPMVCTTSLSASQFEVIFQLTYHLTEVREASLAKQGCSQEDAQALLATVEEIRTFVDHARAEDVLSITIGISDHTDAQPGRPTAPVRHAAPSPTEHSTLLPQRLARLWPAILRFTVDALGEAEIFYRTGYKGAEIDDALRALAVGWSGDSTL